MAELKDLGGMVFNSFPDEFKHIAIFRHIWQENFPGRQDLEAEEVPLFEEAVKKRYGQKAVDWANAKFDEDYESRVKEAEEDEDLWI